jgi:hypothetical protein
MFPHWKKSGMGEHKMAKNMFPTYTKRHIFEQSDIFHAVWFMQHVVANMFPHWKKSGIGEHKIA